MVKAITTHILPTLPDKNTLYKHFHYRGDWTQCVCVFCVSVYGVFFSGWVVVGVKEGTFFVFAKKNVLNPQSTRAQDKKRVIAILPNYIQDYATYRFNQ